MGRVFHSFAPFSPSPMRLEGNLQYRTLAVGLQGHPTCYWLLLFQGSNLYSSISVFCPKYYFWLRCFSGSVLLTFWVDNSFLCRVILCSLGVYQHYQSLLTICQLHPQVVMTKNVPRHRQMSLMGGQLPLVEIDKRSWHTLAFCTNHLR